VEVLKFFLENKVEKTKIIREGLYEMRKRFPWRIGTIYNYKTGTLTALQVKIGNMSGANKNYTLSGNTIMFSWLDANQHGRLLREIVSDDSLASNLSVTVDEKTADSVRDLLLDSKEVRINVLKKTAIDKVFRSFLQNSLGEDYLFIPEAIENIKLLPGKVEKTEEVDNPTSESFHYAAAVNHLADVKLYLNVLKY